MLKNSIHISILIILALLASVSLAMPALASPPDQSADGVIRAVVFWMEGCPHCHYVLDDVLPPLREKYAGKLEIKLVEVVTTEDVDLLLRTAASFGIPKEQVGVPLMIIGEHVLIGSDQIPAALPGLIENYLAAGGVNYPNIFTESGEIAAPQPIAPVADSSLPADSPASPMRSNGFGLAIAIMVGMVGALVYSGVVFVRGIDEAISVASNTWRDYAIPVASLIGLGVAAYLAYVETQAVEAVCGPVGDCNAVQTSSYAYLFGVIPIGVLGVVGYLTILAVWLYARLRHDRLAQIAPFVIFVMTFFGVVFSLYLTYLEPFVIRAVCIWCLISAVIMTVLLLLSLRPAILSLNSKWNSDAKEETS